MDDTPNTRASRATVGRRHFLGMVATGAAAGATGVFARPLGAWGSEWPSPSRPNAVEAHGGEVATAWHDLYYRTVMQNGWSPPRGARTYAYAAVALYESVLPSMPTHRSLGRQLNDMPAMPHARDVAHLDWPSAANAALAVVARGLFGERPESTQPIDTLDAEIDRQRRDAGVADRIRLASQNWGATIGRAVLGWAATDGHAGVLGRSYTPPLGEDKWVSTPPNFGTAIEPYWSEVRCFALPHARFCEPRPPIPFSREEGSEFWRQAYETYEVGSRTHSDAGLKETAVFWRDNPVESGTPAGHWLWIAHQVAEEQGLHLGATAELLALTAVALADAFTSCWTEKYRTNLLRPITYINRYIDRTWRSFVNTPQFPEYTSGHSVASTAAAGVLTRRLGVVSFRDSSKTFMNLPPRTYRSFFEAAHEAAGSRLAGGIHYPMGIEEGLTQGGHVWRTVLDRVHTRR